VNGFWRKVFFTTIITLGYGFDGYLDTAVNYSEKSKLLGMMKMLGGGRADVTCPKQSSLFSKQQA